MNRREVEILMKRNLGSLTRQQIKTFRGQLNAGDTLGAYKGLMKVLKRLKLTECS